MVITIDAENIFDKSNIHSLLKQQRQQKMDKFVEQNGV